MSAKRNAPKQAPPSELEPEQRDTVTFSVRLTEAQRDLVTRAAELRGWTPTNLLRVAALEKAAHIVNTSTLTQFDFKTPAAKIAQEIFSERICYEIDEFGGKHERDEIPEGYPTEIAPARQPIEFLFLLKEAARFGGAEFLNLIVEQCEGITAHSRQDLPQPVDPNPPSEGKEK